MLAAGLACAAGVIVAVVASRYRPVGYGSLSSGSEAFPGLPAGRGIHPVNNLGGFHEDIYIPPQRGTFSLFADIANTGTHPVTIVSASLGQISPFFLSALVRYSMAGMGGSDQIPPPVSRVLHDVVLRPGQQMFLGFPVHMWPCTTSQGWEGISSFYVRVRYLVFTHTVAVPWGMRGDSLLVRSPGGRPGQKGVVCAPGTTRANLPKVPAENPGPQPVAGTIIRIYKGHDVGELRLMQMTGPDAATNLGNSLPACFLQYPPGLARPPADRVVNFDLNWADTNLGQRGTAPAIRVTITGPDGEPMVAAVPQATAGNGIACRTVRSFPLGQQTTGWQLVYGLTLRVPQLAALNHLLVTADGHTITVPLTPACGTPPPARSASQATNSAAPGPPEPRTPST
ncbi:MAG TPA: hypothetical protein VMV17_11090 [Streptosporangiaceae bacterium]|nr:hypothetical protein [Streptosporangiaceae bacterium]